MAEGKITITILSEGSGTGDGKDKLESKEKDSGSIVLDALNAIVHPLKTAGTAIKEDLTEALGEGAGVSAAIGMGTKLAMDALSTAYSIAMMEHNRYFTLTEDYLAQNKMNMIQTQISNTKSMLSSIGGKALSYGTIGFATAGPVGAVVGAAIGAVVGGVKSGISLATERDQKIEQYNMQLNATNAQTSFMASRASLVNGGRGTEY